MITKFETLVAMDRTADAVATGKRAFLLSSRSILSTLLALLFLEQDFDWIERILSETEHGVAGVAVAYARVLLGYLKHQSVTAEELHVYLALALDQNPYLPQYLLEPDHHRVSVDRSINSSDLPKHAIMVAYDEKNREAWASCSGALEWLASMQDESGKPTEAELLRMLSQWRLILHCDPTGSGKSSQMLCTQGKNDMEGSGTPEFKWPAEVGRPYQAGAPITVLEISPRWEHNGWRHLPYSCIEKVPFWRILLAEPLVCACCSTKVAALLVCSACRAIGYCGKDCQKEDWRRHKKQCSKNSKTAAVVPRTSLPPTHRHSSGSTLLLPKIFGETFMSIYLGYLFGCPIPSAIHTTATLVHMSRVCKYWRSSLSITNVWEALIFETDLSVVSRVTDELEPDASSPTPRLRPS
jgi:hypothetical protein